MNMNHRQVAHEFADKYYKLLQQTPDQLYKFYKKHSVFVFSRDSDGAQSSSTGQEEIHNGITFALQAFCGHNTIVSRSQIDSQASRGGGLLVLVTGQLMTYDGYCQHFTQTFMLDRQELPTPGYFVLSDFLRYVEVNPVPPVQQCPPGGPVMPADGMMMGQDQCLPPQLGGMQMMAPHDAGGYGLQPGMSHPSMMQQVHHLDGPTAPVSMVPMDPMLPLPGGEAVPTGFPAVQPMQAPAPQAASGPNHHRKLVNQAASIARGGGGAMVEAAVLEEPPHLPEVALAQEPAPTLPEASGSEVPKVEGADGDTNGRHEADAEVELDMEDYEDDEGLAEDMIPQLEEMEAHDDGDRAAGGQDSGAAGVDDLQDVSGYIDEFAFFDEQPRSWASMAGKLKEGGGQLVQSKVQGFGMTPGAAAAKATASAVPSSGSAARAQDRAGERGAVSSGSPGGELDVWLWVSRLPIDTRIEGQEVLDCISSHLPHDVGCALDIDRKEQSQEWANVSVSSQEAADFILHLSRERKLLLRGRTIKADVHKVAYLSRQRGRNGAKGSAEGSSKGAGRGRAAALEGGGDDDRSGEGKGEKGEGKGAGRARRRVGRGHGSDAAAWRASPS